MDPFETLGIQRTFDVDLASVAKTHRELSRALHPDRHAGASASARRQALAKAVEVNEAWRIVRDPIRRAQALFELAGIGVGEGREAPADPGFLMDMLEQREALAEAKATRDLRAVRALAEAIATRSAEAERELARGFADGPDAALAGKLGELRFYRRFLDEVRIIEDELAA